MGTNISLNLRDNLKDSDIRVSGFELIPMSNEVARKFGIIVGTRGYHPQLWSACRRIYGRVPDWFFTQDMKSERWDEYKRLRENGTPLEEVKLQKRAVGARIIEVKSKPAARVARKQKNRSKKVATFDISLEDSISTEFSRSTSNEWSVGSETTVSVEIGGELSQAKTTVEQTISFGYTRGEEESKTKGDSITVSSGIEVELQPGEEAVASMSCSRGQIIVDVDYECSLTGTAMFAFAKRHHNGRRDHYIDIERLLPLVGSDNLIRVTDRMGLGFVSEGEAVLEDR